VVNERIEGIEGDWRNNKTGCFAKKFTIKQSASTGGGPPEEDLVLCIGKIRTYCHLCSASKFGDDGVRSMKWGTLRKGNAGESDWVSWGSLSTLS
jgi:hypothetical protein